ncbi:MAG: VanZ family protein [Eubacterium sp.]|nr:VanZ family protein [Eubacterium sp.]
MNSRKKLAILFWILTAICFVVIFIFSSDTADESSRKSGYILQFIIDIFGDNAATDFIVRKSAHFLEFTGTALLMSAAFYYTLGKNKIHLPIIFTSLYAVTDEVHQIFVDGRSCELRDWAIDTLGATLGAISFMVIFTIIIKAKEFRKRGKNK